MATAAGTLLLALVAVHAGPVRALVLRHLAAAIRTSYGIDLRARSLSYNALTLSAELHGRAMGPEGSIAKLLWSEAEQHISEVASEVLGPDALAGSWARDRVYSRALTIAGGTTQVNKNIVAQRILGLPRN